MRSQATAGWPQHDHLRGLGKGRCIRSPSSLFRPYDRSWPFSDHPVWTWAAWSSTVAVRPVAASRAL